MGTGRQDLREIVRGLAPVSELWPYVPGWLGLTTAYGMVIFAAFKSWLTRLECGPRSLPVRLWVLCVLVPAISAFLIFCLSIAVGVPFWGRHLAGTFPFAGRYGSVAVLLFLLLSAALVRFHPDHRHDDYRQAAKLAIEQASGGREVWWVAGYSGAQFYGADFVDSGPGIQHAPNRASLPPVLPDVIIISRPENFDIQGTAGEMVRSGAYHLTGRLQAFEIWTK